MSDYFISLCYSINLHNESYCVSLILYLRNLKETSLIYLLVTLITPINFSINFSVEFCLQLYPYYQVNYYSDFADCIFSTALFLGSFQKPAFLETASYVQPFQRQHLSLLPVLNSSSFTMFCKINFPSFL